MMLTTILSLLAHLALCETLSAGKQFATFLQTESYHSKYKI